MPKLLTVYGAVSCVALLAGAGEASASAKLFDPSVSTCTGANCSSIRLDGTITSFGPSSGSWIGELFAGPNECMRLEVTSPTGGGADDLEITAIAPNGSVFRDDDSGAGLAPLVRINGTPNNGWYTVQVNQFAGSAVDKNFTLFYGRYNVNNPNCLPGTTPVIGASGGAKAGAAVSGGTTGGKPGE